MPAVSIVMRSRNDMPLIAAALAAVSRQHFRDFELLNVDCASDDGTVEEIRRYNPAGPIAIPPGSYVPGRVLNAAIARCSGRIIVFNNSDCIPQNET
ncbi:MAG: glycosyltransferase family A protein, partial [Victivallales bacterium]|nr:glycosyltransferase family A protein [Victivallales bacterium]